MSGNQPQELRVAYLLGAGATHACIKAVNSPFGILMKDLGDELARQTHSLAQAEFADKPEIHSLVNQVVDENVDYEHIITFLEGSASALHQSFAAEVKKIFINVLRARFAEVEGDHRRKPIELYSCLIDLHEVPGNKEKLSGVLTLNYDDYFEQALIEHGKSVDLGVTIGGAVGVDAVQLMKLHGSFNWTETWPVALGNDPAPLWIPPGILKEKHRYPFNIIWGKAREILNCDLLRIVGCRLSQNDWDLVSLLFSSRWARTDGKPYQIEIIDCPKQAIRLRSEFPYLEVVSIVEIDRLGEQLVAELIAGQPRKYIELSPYDQKRLLDAAGPGMNWFRHWLILKAEDLYGSLGSLETRLGFAGRLLN